MSMQPMASALLIVVCVALGGAASPAAATPAPGAWQHHHGPHGQDSKPPQQPPAQAEATQDHGAHEPQPPAPPHPPIPPLTDEDRAAAFPDVEGHTVHDDVVHYYVLFDQLEWRGGSGGGVSWDNKGWIGRDIDRLWFRTEGASEDGRLEEGEAHLLYGRAFSRWWEVVAGVRQDFRPGPAQTWAAFGVQGLAPYWFEVEATAYVGGGGRTHFRLEAEYELLLTNRLILQPLAEADIYGKADPERGLGAGLSSIDMGLRLRYEFRRELAPYIGFTWERKFFGTADRARAAGYDVGGPALALGLRVWF
jgi:copper resistance protein B